MCASLMSPEQARTEDLNASIKRKLAKFSSLAGMPTATRKLVEAGLAELKIRRSKEVRDATQSRL